VPALKPAALSLPFGASQVAYTIQRSLLNTNPADEVTTICSSSRPAINVRVILRRYAATVGHLEPSYVIQRYLDVQRIHSLTGYLERLHAQV